MATVLAICWAVFLVVIMPIGLGLLIPSRQLAVGIWLIVVTVMW